MVLLRFCSMLYHEEYRVIFYGDWFVLQYPGGEHIFASLRCLYDDVHEFVDFVMKQYDTL